MSDSSSEGDRVASLDVVTMWPCCGEADLSSCDDELLICFGLVTFSGEEAVTSSLILMPPDRDELGDARSLSLSSSLIYVSASDVNQGRI